MKHEYGAAPLNLDLTYRLCDFIAGFRYDDLPDGVVHEARRGILDWLGCALAGSRHDTISTLLDVLGTVSGGQQSTVIARGMKLGVIEAAMANGQMGHLLDFDDTHMGGVILHASSPILAALFALSEIRPVSGRDFIAAYVAGFEAGVRVGQSAPSHHDGGWHLTGTLGTIAAGVACARLLGLSARQTTHAAGIAATQSAGMQQNRGTMCKSFHAGRAASNGVLAALLAEKGFDSSIEIFEGKRGFSRIYSTTTDLDKLTAKLGEDWMITGNGYKPHACGVVQHPMIDAMIALARNHDIAPESINSVHLKLHPGVIRITGVENPENGLKSKFSLTHSAAVGYLDRTAGVRQYSNERASSPDVISLRNKITAEGDDSLRKDEARATIKTTDGKRFEHHIPHAAGTVDNPMSDSEMKAKFTGNAETVLSAEDSASLMRMVWQFDRLDSVASLLKLV